MSDRDGRQQIRLAVTIGRCQTESSNSYQLEGIADNSIRISIAVTANRISPRRREGCLFCEFSMVEAAGVEPASENVTGQENYMLSRVHAPGITLGRSRRALRTDKKRVPLACGLNPPPQT